ncbi:hypothetical protein ABKA04_004410 [Annulohypoxylon sp. FPYF3050]
MRGTYAFDNGTDLLFPSPLYWLPLNETIDISGLVNVSLLGSVDLPYVTVNRTSISTFFYDQTSLYPFGGLDLNADVELNNETWEFNTTENIWTLFQVQGANDSFRTASDGAYTSDSATGRSFYVDGGFNTIRFQSSNSISTLTLGKGISPNDGGTMVYVRKGLSGILLSIGGRERLAKSTLSPFSNISVYDISSDTWYTQKATGDIPNTRSDFCAGVSAAPDDSSFQVTIHGGAGEDRGPNYNDVYVLTIPSFRWIKMNDSGNPDLRIYNSTGRVGHNCDVWNEAQLIISGGAVYLPVDDNDPQSAVWSVNGECNKTYPPFKVLDTSTYTWQTKLNSGLEYTVPVSVFTVIGGK